MAPTAKHNFKTIRKGAEIRAFCVFGKGGFEMAQGNIQKDGYNHMISAENGQTLLAVFRAEGFAVASPCGGNGTCGKCKVVAHGMLSEMTEDERRFLRPDEIEAGIRLACKTKIKGDFEVVLPSAELSAETRFQALSYTLSPMAELVSDEKNFGLAVDIGTTTVAVYLCDMETGKILGTRGFANPQSAYGADVISRIDKIMKNKTALTEQKQRVLDAISEACRTLAEENGGDASHIRAAVICGNTVMEHIAAEIDPTSIANAPFIAPTLFGECYDAKTIGLPMADGAKIYFAPCFASYVGGDIACGMIAVGLDKEADNVLFIDIGTNGEIGLSTKNGLYFCSAAAGPAFEGAHIECGMAGTAGAVSRVYLDGDKILWETVDGKTPCGICGSGIIDACAVMLDTGLLDETGCIMDADEVERFSEYLDEDDDGNTVFMLDKINHIYITGKDIREIQLAKAAIAAGIRTLLEKAELKISDVSAVMLAGGFGSHIDAKSACRIGLIPRELDGKVTSVGNVAGAGAVAILLGKEPRESARTICGKSEYIELSCDAFFMEAYIDEMMFEE